MLVSTVFSDESAHWAIFEQEPTSKFSPIATKTPVRSPRMVIHSTHKEPHIVTYKFEVHFITLASGATTNPELDAAA